MKSGKVHLRKLVLDKLSWENKTRGTQYLKDIFIFSFRCLVRANQINLSKLDNRPYKNAKEIV